MKKSNVLKIAVAVVAGLGCTGAMIGSVYAASNNSLSGHQKVQFTADKYVNAKVEIFLNGELDKEVTFVDTKNSDDNQSVNLSEISGDKWIDNVETIENEIDKKAEVKFVVKNTSSRAKLNVSIVRSGVGENCEIVDPTITTASDLLENGSAEFVFTFSVNGLDDVAEFVNDYAVTLEAAAL